jgi:hypothetical protein
MAAMLGTTDDVIKELMSPDLSGEVFEECPELRENIRLRELLVEREALFQRWRALVDSSPASESFGDLDAFHLPLCIPVLGLFCGGLFVGGFMTLAFTNKAWLW